MSDEQRTLTANFTADSSGFAAGANETIRKLRELNSQVIENKQKIKDTNAEIRKYQQELNDLKSSTENGASASADQRKRMQELTDSIAKCKVNLGVLATAQQRLQSNVRAVNKELDGQREAARDASAELLSMGDIIKANLGSEAIMGAINVLNGGLRQAAVYCYGVGTEFEAAMSQVEAVSGASGESLDALTKKAKELGSSTKFTATQVAEAMNYMAMAGWDAEQMLGGIDGVIGLAAASGADLATVSDIVTDALTAFSMKAEDAGHFSDVLAAASANANTNVTMLGESFKYVAPLAGTMGYSIEDVAEALGIMANSGIKASTAGTALRSVLTNLANGVEIEAAAFGKVKISAADADGSMKSLNEVFGELRNAFSQMNEQEQTANAKLIAGQEALSGFLALVNAQTADIEKLRGAIESCDGAASKMADTMQDNVAGKATVLKSALEGLGIAIYDRFAEPLGKTLDNVTEKIEKLGDSAENGVLADTFDDLAESAGNAAEELVDFIGDALPDFIGGVSDVLKFLVDCRVEIASVVKAFIAYKAAIKGKDIFTSFAGSIKNTIVAFKALKKETDETAESQKKLNAAFRDKAAFTAASAAISLLVAGLSELEAHLDDCNERSRAYMESVEELKQASEEYHDKATEMGDIAREYDEITKSAGDTATKTERLKELQDRLVEKFGSEAEGIDLVTDAFAQQAITLGILNVKREEYEKISREMAEQGLKDLQNAENEKTAINVGNVYSGIDYSGLSTIDMGSTLGAAAGQNALNYALKGPFASLENRTAYLSGTFEERLEDLQKFKTRLARDGKSATETYKQVEGLIYQMEQDVKDKAKYQQILGNYYNGDFSGDDDTDTESSRAANIEKYNAEKEDLDIALSSQEISHKEYYDRLRALRDKYFDEGSESWVKANDEISEFLRRNNGQIVNDICGSTESAADKIGKAVDKTGDKIKGVFSDIKSEFQELLDGIDRELAKHNRDKEDEEYRSRIESLTNRLRYEKLDIYTRRSLEKELDDLSEDWGEVKFKRDNADKKSLVQEAAKGAGVIASNASDITKLTQTQWDNIIAAFRGASPYISSSDFTNETAQNVYNIVINGSNKTEKQIEDEIMRKISSEVV